ncbi:putative eamA-like transporter family protein [Lyophyllum shimeji]|uniref:EamA-like transporter family protein n=1 Tax=Lyophyllum shimeji TaxID=47721 RepID=A0A9P3PW74_LYOSH|nr:putative eamA-like transporter family protein [Lyophyllum shimeji]
MSSRNAYAAATPDYADFATAQAARALQDAGTSEPPTPEDPIEGEQRLSKWRATYVAAVDLLKANTGLLLVTASEAFFSLMNVAVKKLNSIDPPVSTFELIAVRMIITYVCSMIYMLYAKVPDPWLGPKGVRLLLVFRGFSGFFGLFGIYYSLQYLSLSDATVLTFLAPLCTGIAGAIFLKEKYTKKEALASIFSLIGVVLIARPVFLFGNHNRTEHLSFDAKVAHVGPDDPEKSTPEQRLMAVGVAMIGVLGATGAYISITAVGKRAHPLHAMTSFSSQSIVVAVIAMLIRKTPIVVPTQLEWVALLIMIGIFGFVAQILLTMGLQRETAGRGSIAVYTQIVFATILQRIFFKTTPDILSVMGTLIILTVALYIAMTKQQAKKKSSVRLSGIPEGALEEGLLEGLLASHTEDQGVKTTPEAPCDAQEAQLAQETRPRISDVDTGSETTALPVAEGSEDAKAART